MAKKKRSRKKRRPIINLSRFLRAEVVGIVLLALALLTLLSLASVSRGAITEGWLRLLRRAFGWGAYLAPFGLGAAGIWLLLRSLGRAPQVGWAKPAAGFSLFIALLAFVHLLSSDPQALAARGGGGGYLGYLVSQALASSLGRAGAYVAIATLSGAALIVLLGLSAAQIGQALREGWRRLRRIRRPRIRRPRPKILAPSSPQGPIFPRIIGGEQRWRLPPIDEILEEASEQDISQAEIRARVRIIEETLASFGVPARVVEVNQGPVITQFGVEPGYIERRGKRTKVKVSQIAKLADDLALALAASPVRIEAPVPGRSIVGIEVPNARVSLVSLRSVMQTEAFRKVGSKLAIALGQDVSGQPVVADLAAMPHLLIAGATGSGKSVCINSIVTCLLCNNTPDELKLLMIDPKRVELIHFNGIPHLLAPVVVELERAVGTLRWVMREMDGRYKKLAGVGARNIGDYNQLAAARGEKPLPAIVVVVDELADLMMLAPDEIERLLCRIAQMARATGIHLVIATQRPSVDVVTGLIKANFPARISFAVTSQVDSRVVLDMGGAERLLGRGDMLFMTSDSSQPIRLQGCFVSDREVSRLVHYWKHARAARGAEEMVQPPLWGETKAKEEDELLEQAIEVVRKHGRASISLLQRKLRIGYSRAARLIDLMEERGIVAPAEGGGRSRRVLTEGEASPTLGNRRRDFD